MSARPAGRGPTATDRPASSAPEATAAAATRRRPPEVAPAAPSPREAATPDPFAMPVVALARMLVGWEVWHDGVGGLIVETEAYHDSEPACHAHVGLTARTHVLFGPPGRAYVYRSYGIHALLNVVAEPEGIGAAVLVRALEPLAGVERMRARRGLTRLEDLCSGPGKLTQALGIGLDLNDTDLREGPVRLVAPAAGMRRPRLAVGPRVGITKAADLPWRFSEAGSRFVSRPRPPGDAARRR